MDPTRYEKPPAASRNKQWTDLRTVDGQWWYWPPNTPQPQAGPFSTYIAALTWPGLQPARERIQPPVEEPQPNANTIAPATATFDLRKLPAVIRSIPRNAARLHRAFSILHSLDFQHVTADIVEPSERHWTNQPLQFARLLHRHDAPWIHFEDDIATRAFCPFIKPPPNSQFIQLGAGRDGRSRGIYHARKAGLKPKHQYQYGYIDEDQLYMRVFGMYYLHALVILDKSAALELEALERQLKRPVDVITAENQHRWKWYTLKTPMFWQNDGHHTTDTYDYAPSSR